MENNEKLVAGYEAPAVVFETSLEVRAGSQTGILPDVLNQGQGQ
jgi:hypothetical protein